MAKIKGLAATALRKSAGKLTFRNTVYGNIASQKIVNMTNPQSVQQSFARAKTKYVTKGYSVLKKIANHSIEGFASGAKTMNEWKRLNSALLANVADDKCYFYPKSKSFANVLPFDGLLSKGSLSFNLGVKKDSAIVMKGDAADPKTTLFNIGNILEVDDLSTMTLERFLEIAGCDYGDEVCGCFQLTNAAIYGKNITEGYVYNILESEYAVLGDSSKAKTPVFIASNIFPDMFKFNPAAIVTEGNNSCNYLLFQKSSTLLQMGFAKLGASRAQIIRSKKVDGNWKRSNSMFESQDDIDNDIYEAIAAANLDAIYTYSLACETYQKSALTLNNATA